MDPWTYISYFQNRISEVEKEDNRSCDFEILLYIGLGSLSEKILKSNIWVFDDSLIFPFLKVPLVMICIGGGFVFIGLGEQVERKYLKIFQMNWQLVCHSKASEPSSSGWLVRL